MAVPVAIYLAFNAGGPGAHGWGAAMSTDTAFALGALALLTPRGATRLRVFLLTLAVVDDLGALLVIATAYTTHVSLAALAVAIGLFGRAPRRCATCPRGRRQLSVVVGVALWVAMFKSGIDPVIAGLAVGLVTSAYPPSREDLERATALTRSFREQPTPELARSAQLGVLVGDLAQRAPAVRPASLDELRDRAAVRARQRGHPRDRWPARRRDHLADHARDPLRLRGRQAAGHPRRLVARHAAGACTGRARR